MPACADSCGKWASTATGLRRSNRRQHSRSATALLSAAVQRPRCASATLAGMNQLHGKHIVLGMSGGVAAFKSAELCRRLTKAGATVQVVMTESATQFMTPVTMQALSNRPVYTSQWDA